MLIQVNTGHNIKGSEELDGYVQSTIEASLGRFGEHITHVEVHLSDDNGDKSHGDDKRCLIEARPAGMQPIVVTHVGATIDEALDGAAERLERLLNDTFSKLHDPKGRTSLGHDVTVWTSWRLAQVPIFAGNRHRNALTRSQGSGEIKGEAKRVKSHFRPSQHKYPRIRGNQGIKAYDAFLSPVGAALFSPVKLFNIHPTGQALKDQRLEVMMAEGGIADCSKAGNCVVVCQKD